MAPKLQLLPESRKQAKGKCWEEGFPEAGQKRYLQIKHHRKMLCSSVGLVGCPSQNLAVVM